jgi:hypothetical protein
MTTNRDSVATRAICPRGSGSLPGMARPLNDLDDLFRSTEGEEEKEVARAACRAANGDKALTAIAGLLPREDMWQSAAGTVEVIAEILDTYGIERPDHYDEDVDIR